VARLIELPVGGGGGPAVEALAREGNASAVPLPVPMKQKRSFDLSFAGLKTAVRLAVQRAPDAERDQKSFRADVAASFQHAAFSHVEQRLKYVMAFCDEQVQRLGVAPSTLVLSGGVAANAELRRRLQRLCEQTAAPDSSGYWRLVVPPPRLCTDNGVMVAWAAVEWLRLGTCHVAEGQQVRARWPLGPSVTTITEADQHPAGDAGAAAQVEHRLRSALQKDARSAEQS